jgi:hypothetical protein
MGFLTRSDRIVRDLTSDRVEDALVAGIEEFGFEGTALVFVVCAFFIGLGVREPFFFDIIPGAFRSASDVAAGAVGAFAFVDDRVTRLLGSGADTGSEFLRLDGIFEVGY